MGLKKCGLNLNRAQKELRAHGTPDFPCAGYAEIYTDQPEDVIPWHWHEELEIVYIHSGALQLQLPSEVYELHRGDCAVINSSILHYGAARPECELYSMVFNAALITGGKDSVFSRKYMQPLMACPSFVGYRLKAAEDQEVIRHFTEAFKALSTDAFGYEFAVREGLSRICCHIFRQLKEKIGEKDSGFNQDNLRIREMLACIHDNYSDRLTLGRIARAADIGERECLRCFKRTIRLSPMQYLLKYRITQGAAMLLDHPEGSVSETASRCGFDSPSNFSAVFRRFYGCTPLEYRSGRNSYSPISEGTASADSGTGL